MPIQTDKLYGQEHEQYTRNINTTQYKHEHIYNINTNKHYKYKHQHKDELKKSELNNRNM